MFFRKIKNKSVKKTGAIVLGGHFQGLGVIRSLGSKKIPVLLLDKDWCIGRFSRYLTGFLKCPDVQNEPEMLDFLVQIKEQYALKDWVVYPTDDEGVYFLSKYNQLLSQHFRLTTPGLDVIQYTHNKKLTYRLAEKMGICIPKTFYPDNVNDLAQIDCDFPLIVKPAVVKKFFNVTKVKAYITNNQAQLEQAYLKISEIIDPSEILVQEMIPGNPRYLYSFCPLFKDGQVLARVIARRARQHPMDLGHASTFAETVNIPELEQIGVQFLKKINYDGLAEVEFKQDPRDGKYKFLEINSRVWGWHTLAIRAGVDLPYLLYQATLDQPVFFPGFKEGSKWVRLVTDLPTVWSEIIKKRMRIADYFQSLRGPKEFAVLSGRDPLPFFVELALLPYLYFKRGF